MLVRWGYKNTQICIYNINPILNVYVYTHVNAQNRKRNEYNKI